MAKAIYIGVGGVSRVAKAGYIGVNGVARKFTGDAFGTKQIIIQKGSGTSTAAIILYTDADGNYQEIRNMDLSANTLVSIRTPSKVYVLADRYQNSLILDSNSNYINPTSSFPGTNDFYGVVYQF